MHEPESSLRQDGGARASRPLFCDALSCNHFGRQAFGRRGGSQLQGAMATTRQNQEASSQRKVEGARPARSGTDERLRGEVQQQIFRSKLLMLRARELLDALLALARGRHN